MIHVPVLKNEVIRYLSPRPGENFVDGTCGAAGHTREILKHIGGEGKILCLDLDKRALRRAKEQFKDSEQIIFINENFANLREVAEENNFSSIDGILVDLGMSSDQLDSSAGEGRGFSFLKDEPLDMRFFDEQALTAREIINQWLREDLERIFKEYGEERFFRKISQRIIGARKLKPIMTTKELVGVIAEAVPVFYQRGKIHFATKIFQALRIAVNGELDNLKIFLPVALEKLKIDGRLVVISFHSLEDRIVKNFFRQSAKEGRTEILTKKPVTPTIEEINQNPRSRSAKLRAVRKIA